MIRWIKNLKSAMEARRLARQRAATEDQARKIAEIITGLVKASKTYEVSQALELTGNALYVVLLATAIYSLCRRA